MARKPAKLRVCASCEWIYKGITDCPECGFGSYGARFVYGKVCYRYAKTQKPWFDRKVGDYKMGLYRKIEELNKQNKKKSANNGI